MAIQIINTGSGANAGDGDSLRSAFTKVNNNFNDLVNRITTGTENIFTGEVPPAGPLTGDLWWDSISGNLYIYYDTTWIPASSSNAGGSMTLYDTKANNFNPFTQANQGTGELTGLGVTSSGVVPNSMAFDVRGRYIYVSNYTNNTIDQYVVNQNFGTIVGVETTPTGLGPLTLKVDNTGELAFVTNYDDDTIHSYGINPSTGNLTFLSTTTTADAPYGISIDPQTNFAYVTTYQTGRIYVFEIDKTTGTLSERSVTTVSNGLSSITVDPTGRFAYAVNDVTNELYKYQISQTTGALTSISGPSATGDQPVGLHIEGSGRFLYVANFNDDTISQYEINRLSGQLTSNGTIATGAGPWHITTDPLGKFLYVTNSLGDTVGQYEINQTTGKLLLLGTIATGNRPWAITVDPKSRFVFVSNSLGNTISGYNINNFSAGNANFSGSLNVGGNVTPMGDLAYDLGSPSRQWRSLYVGTSTIYLGGIPLSVNTDSSLTVNGLPVVSYSTSGSFIVDGNTVAGGGGGPDFYNLGNSNLTLHPTQIQIGDNLTGYEVGDEGSGIYRIDATGGGGSIAVGDGSGPSVENVTEILINGTVTEIEPGLVGISVTGEGLPSITVPGEVVSTYKGLQVAYGRIYSNSNSDELNVNKIVIHKPAASTVTIDPTGNRDNFQVSGISSSDVLAMFVLYGDVNGPKPVSTLEAFAQAAIDTVILDGGQEGQYNSVEAMKTAFYAEYPTLSAAAGGLYQTFQFFTTNLNTLNGGPTTTRQGSGAVFDVSNNGDGTYSVVSIVNSGTNYLPGHRISIPGETLGATVGAVSAMIVTNGPNPNWSTTSILDVVPGLEFLFTVDGSGNATVSNITDSGPDRNVGDTFTLLGTALGLATPADDINFEVTAITFAPYDAIITVTSATDTSIVAVEVTGTAPDSSSTVYTNLTGTNYNVGSGFTVGSVSNSGFSTDSIGSNYVVGDVLTLLGENITGGTTPTNNITITVNAVDGLGQAYGYTSSGTFPQVWPTNFISDGGEDQYDDANYISTNLANNIAYNSGNTVSDGTAAFGTGSSYTFVYNTGTFALFATGTNVTLIRTSGNSGADGSSVTDSGHIYGPSTTTSTYDNAVTHLNLVGDVYASPLVTFVKADNTNTVDILIADDGLGAGVGITRDSNNGIYNPYRDDGWDGDVSPSGTLWNIDGWEDFSDVETRTYTNLFAAFGNGGLGVKIVGTECVMYLPDNGKYYAVKFTQWTQGGGGGFAYTRRELDLDNLQQGIRFSDGTILKSAEGVGRVKLTAPNSRRIEEVYGYKQVSVTGVNTTNLTATASSSGSGETRIWIDSTATTIDNILNDTAAAGIWETNTIEFSLDNSTWYKWNGSTSFNGTERGYAVTLPSGTLTYNAGDTVYFRYNTGGEPVVWWDSADLPGGAANFRGAIIKYHAYITDAGSMVGTIHIAKDSGDDNVAHTEVLSGGTDGENAILWYQDDEDQLKYKRIDGESSTVKIQWSATVFYGSEVWD